MELLDIKTSVLMRKRVLLHQEEILIRLIFKEKN